MDSITHLTHKILAERARQQPHPPTTEAPPPYSVDDDDDADADDDLDSESESPALPLKLTINSAHTIRGSNNLIPTSPSMLADATRFSTLLLHAVNHVNAVNTRANADVAQRSKMRRAIRVDLTLDCGITVIGDRNVIGNVGLRPRDPAARGAGAVARGEAAPPAVVAGAKRKADDERPSGEGSGGPAAKKVAASADDE